MLGTAAICLAVVAVIALLWYAFFRRYNRRQGEQVVAWIETALAGTGEVLAGRWRGPALLQLRLRLDIGRFRKPTLMVNLAPRQMPLRWLRQWWRREPAT